VLGRRLADLVLYEVVGLSPAAAGEALSRLKDEGLLREVHGGLEFRNELIRAQAYYAVAGPARQHLHQKVGETLVGRMPEDGQMFKLEVAWHFLRGGDMARAATNAVEGADAAISFGAPSEAEQILAVLAREEGPPIPLQSLRLLLAKAYLHQSKAHAARPLLELLERNRALSIRDNAEIVGMQAAVEYLLNTDPGRRYCDVSDRALRVARRTNDLGLIGKALFECARSGANIGDETRVTAAKQEAQSVLAQAPARIPPILFYAKAYCDYFSYELQAAAAALEEAIRLLSEPLEPAGLSLAYTGYGNCKQGLCEFDTACQLFAKALELSQRIGDDQRSAVIASNLCATRLHQGDYESSLHFGELAVTLGMRALSPRLIRMHVNLATAHLIRGHKDAALRSIQAAQDSSQYEHSWSATMEFLISSASLALMRADTTRALDFIESAEQLACGKERAVPGAGLFDKLRIFRRAHVFGPRAARELVTACQEKYRDRHPLYYLNSVACEAWLDLLLDGHYTEESRKGLELFDRLGARGLRAILVAQGFLS
jgi:tetratricopeptide (TPR) repeat protein